MAGVDSIFGEAVHWGVKQAGVLGSLAFAHFPRSGTRREPLDAIPGFCRRDHRGDSSHRRSSVGCRSRDPNSRLVARHICCSSFFGNLAYIGLPILAHSLGPVALGDSPELLATALIAMTVMTVFNNALAASLFRKERFEIRGLVRLIVTNPIVIAGCLGIGYGMTGLSVPYVFDDVLRTLGATAVPLALISIGGSLEMTPLRGRISWIACASALQVIVFPLIAWVICRTLNLDPADSRIVLIFCACPTAAVTYTMASQMGGDEALAAGAIAMSTVASFVSLAVVLGIT